MNTAQLSAADPPVDIRSADGVTNRAQSHRRDCAPDPGTRIVASGLSVTQVDSPSAALHRFLQGVRRLWSADLAEQAREHRHALVLLESHQMAQQKRFAHDLAAERSLRERAEAAESAIRHTLKFKDAVIQEADHRVKNTLQVAASLLSLHANSAASAEVRLALRQSHDRLHVLARMHELLSASTESSQAILMPTLLQAVGDALRQSFAEASARVRLQITSDAIELPPSEATALALVANEVLTNAYKHAFPNDASGEVTVDFRCGPENTMILQITDSGVGMHSDSSQDGLGLKLIHVYVEQLRGTLAIGLAGAAGTAVTLTFQRHAKKFQEHSQASAR